MNSNAVFCLYGASAPYVQGYSGSLSFTCGSWLLGIDLIPFDDTTYGDRALGGALLQTDAVAETDVGVAGDDAFAEIDELR